MNLNLCQMYITSYKFITCTYIKIPILGFIAILCIPNDPPKKKKKKKKKHITLITQTKSSIS